MLTVAAREVKFESNRVSPESDISHHRHFQITAATVLNEKKHIAVNVKTIRGNSGTLSCDRHISYRAIVWHQRYVVFEEKPRGEFNAETPIQPAFKTYNDNFKSQDEYILATHDSGSSHFQSPPGTL